MLAATEPYRIKLVWRRGNLGFVRDTICATRAEWNLIEESARTRRAAGCTVKVATLLTSWWFPEFHLVPIRIYYPGELPVF
jgi:hypothetical protein